MRYETKLLWIPMIFIVASMGACASARNEAEQREKATICPAVYSPVCDIEGNIYQNSCFAIGQGALPVPHCHVVDLPEPIETKHPYRNNERLSFSIEAPTEAMQLRLDFESFHTERSYDMARLRDGTGEVAAYSGNLGPFLSAPVSGNLAILTFESDRSVTRPGFVVRRYVYFTPCRCPEDEGRPICGTDGRTYESPCHASCHGIGVAFHASCEEGFYRVHQQVESAHPYANNTRQTWTLSESGSFIRAHFVSIDTERGYDYVEILDGEDNVVIRYSGQHDDVTTPMIPGGTLKVRLVSDHSITAHGFVLDYFEVAGGCYDGRDCPAGTGCTQVQCVRAPCWKICLDCPFFAMPPPWFCEGGEIVPRDDFNGCPMPPRCQRAEGATCGGDYGFQCDDGFACREGFCRAVPEECFVGGCSGEVCSDRPDVISTCEYRPWYGCFREAACEVQTSGLCGWTETPELLECLVEHGGPTGQDAGDNEPCGGMFDIQCKEGLLCVGADPASPDPSGVCRKICGPAIPSGFCQEGYFCDITAGAGTENICNRKGRTGVCLPEAQPESCPRLWRPECGCDGVTYANFCRRHVAQVALDHEGSCMADRICSFPSDCHGYPHIMCVGEWACVEGLCEYHCDLHTYFSQDTPIAIPDRGSIRSTIEAGTVGTIEQLTVSVDITHTWRGDLIVELSKGSTVVVLHARTGGSAQNLQLVNVPVTAFYGQVGDGEWTLTVTDAATWDTGTLNSWSIDIN